jgi:hypothetical protein
MPSIPVLIEVANVLEVPLLTFFIWKEKYNHGKWTSETE